MDFHTEESEQSVIVSIKGKLNFKDHPKFNSYLNELKNKKKSVVFDLCNLQMIDSAGIGMLFLAHKIIKNNGASVVIRNPRGQVKRVFDITSIGQEITILEE